MNTSRTRIKIAVSAALLIGVALVGCTSSPAAKNTDTLKIATEGTYPPFSYHDSASGKLVGYDVEVAEAVATKLGVAVSFQETQWDAIFAGLDAGRFDLIANQVSVTDERKAKYLFSSPYSYSPGVAVVRADNDTIKSFADLNGKTTAQSLTSNWKDLAEQSGAKVEGVEGWAQAVELLKQGRVDATINDKLTFLDYTKSKNDTSIKIAAVTPDKGASALTFTKENSALVERVNKALAELASDGTLAKLGLKYFGEDISK